MSTVEELRLEGNSPAAVKRMAGKQRIELPVLEGRRPRCTSTPY